MANVKNLGLYSKSLSVAILGSVAWGDAVASSPSSEITSKEWMALAAIGAAFVVALLVPNARKSDVLAPGVAPGPVADPPHEGHDIPIDTIPALERITGGNWQPPAPEIPAPPIIVAPEAQAAADTPTTAPTTVTVPTKPGAEG